MRYEIKNMYKRHKAEDRRGVPPCECDYQIGSCSEYTWLLLKQPVLEGLHEHIGMRVEQIATEIYFNELSGSDPKKIRVIEYYPPKDFPNSMYSNGLAEQLLKAEYSKPPFIARIFGFKPKFIGYFGHPTTNLKWKVSDPDSFFRERGIVI